MPERFLTRRERLVARASTGALAHLVCGLADWVSLLWSLGRARVGRGRG